MLGNSVHIPWLNVGPIIAYTKLQVYTAVFVQVVFHLIFLFLLTDCCRE